MCRVADITGMAGNQLRNNSLGQDVRANIWGAVLAVGWPVVNLSTFGLVPEVLLSLLPKNPQF